MYPSSKNVSSWSFDNGCTTHIVCGTRLEDRIRGEKKEEEEEEVP